MNGARLPNSVSLEFVERLYEDYLRENDLLRKKKLQNWQERLIEMLRESLLERVSAKVGRESLARFAAQISDHKRDPYSLVEEILAEVAGTQR